MSALWEAWAGLRERNRCFVSTDPDPVLHTHPSRVSGDCLPSTTGPRMSAMGSYPTPEIRGFASGDLQRKPRFLFLSFSFYAFYFSSIKKKKEKKKEGKKTSGWTGNLFSRWYFCSSWDPWSPHIPSHPPLPPTGAEWRSLVTWPYNCRPGHFLFLQKKKRLAVGGYRDWLC